MSTMMSGIIFICSYVLFYLECLLNHSIHSRFSSSMEILQSWNYFLPDIGASEKCLYFHNFSDL